MKAVASALAADDGTTAGALARGETVSFEVDGAPIELSPEDVDLVQETLEGWGVGAEGSITVALELSISPELRREGLAREIIRVVQDARKAARLAVSDRIALGLDAEGELADAIGVHHEEIASETLAVELHAGPLDPADHREDATIDGNRLGVSIAKR